MMLMKNIKVLMLGWEYPPYVTGGLGTHCYFLTKALAKIGVKVYFTTLHPIHKKRGNLEIIGLDISQKFKENGKILSYGHFKNKKVELYTKKIPGIVQKYDFDIIHSQDWPSILAGIKVKKLSGKPLLIWEYDKDKLIADLSGLPKTAINNAVSAYPGIDGARVRVTPFWKRTFPSSTSDIIVVEELKAAE